MVVTAKFTPNLAVWGILICYNKWNMRKHPLKNQNNLTAWFILPIPDFLGWILAFEKIRNRRVGYYPKSEDILLKHRDVFKKNSAFSFKCLGMMWTRKMDGKYRMKTGFTSFTHLQLFDSQFLNVKLGCFHLDSQVFLAKFRWNLWNHCECLRFYVYLLVVN